MVDGFKYPPEIVEEGVKDLLAHETGRAPDLVEIRPGRGGYVVRVEMAGLPKKVAEDLAKVLPDGYELELNGKKKR